MLSRHRLDALWAVGAAAAALLVAVLVLHAWSGIQTVPWFYGGSVPSRFAFDGYFHLMAVKGVLDHGWWFRNPDLGAPFGQQLYDFPLGGYDLQLVALKVIGLGAKQVGTVVNVYYLLTFPATALLAYAAFRWVGLERATAFVVAVLFALLPYHFLRGEYHLFLSMYGTAALGAAIALLVLGGAAPFARREGRSGWRAWLSARSLVTAGVCVAIGSVEPYYANLTMILVVAAALIRALVERRLRPLAGGAAVVALIAVALTANLAPAIVYRLEHGKNSGAIVRPPSDSELYSLNLAQLVVPSRFDRFAPLRKLGQRYTRTETEKDEQTASLGIVGSVGLAWLLVVLVVSVASAARAPDPWLARHRHAASAALVAFLVGTTGGVSALIAWYASAQLRAWNRLSLFIAFFALFAVGLGLEALRRRLAGRRRGPALAAAALAAVLLVGVLDQTSPRLRPNVAYARASFSNDAALVHAIERRMPPRTMIFQLPVWYFPEHAGVFGLQDYDPARPYIVSSSDLRWSYGSVKGRPQADWQLRLGAKKSLSAQLDGIVAVGFRGLWVDTAGYPPDVVNHLVPQLQQLVGVQPLNDPAGRFQFFDLRPYAARRAAALGAAGIERLRRATLGRAA